MYVLKCEFGWILSWDARVLLYIPTMNFLEYIVRSSDRFRTGSREPVVKMLKRWSLWKKIEDFSHKNCDFRPLTDFSNSENNFSFWPLSANNSGVQDFKTNFKLENSSKLSLRAWNFFNGKFMLFRSEKLYWKENL